jgi:RNA polymerase sigma-70 factor (family 1)
MVEGLVQIQSSIAEGDQKAFGRLHQLFYKRLCQFAYTLIRSRQVSEEIVEDVFVKIWSNRGTLSSIENITVYLYVSVKNKALNMLSKKANELIIAPYEFLNIDVSSPAPDPQELMITSEMMQKMQQAIHALPPRCKMIFKLSKEDGLRYKEISQVLNISVNTIDAQMAIATKRICQALAVKQKPVNRFKIAVQKKLS